MAETNTVKASMQHILETYDGISSATIEYNQMAVNRGYWMVGRQILDQKESSKYLDELARQSFVSIYPTRLGKRGLKAWRDDSVSVGTHDESIILKDDNNKPIIPKFEKQPLKDIVNDIKLNYDWNPGLGKFNKSVFITNTDQASFPNNYECTGTDTSRANSASIFYINNGIPTARITVSSDPTAWATVGQYVSFISPIAPPALFGTVVSSTVTTVTFEFVDNLGTGTGSKSSGTFYHHSTGIPKWTTYVGGMADYTQASQWWNICQVAYAETQTINKLEYDCKWYIDNADFDDDIAGGTNNTVFYLLQEILEWNTRQKYIVEYGLPINAATLQLELNDPIVFNDQKFTNNTDRDGFIERIKIIPHTRKPMVMITAVLKPYNEPSYKIIIETGSAPNTITESGSQPDTITEGAQ